VPFLYDTGLAEPGRIDPAATLTTTLLGFVETIDLSELVNTKRNFRKLQNLILTRQRLYGKLERGSSGPDVREGDGFRRSGYK